MNTLASATAAGGSGAGIVWIVVIWLVIRNSQKGGGNGRR